jgi:hypothetical protein
MQACSNQRGRFPGPIAPFVSTILCSIGVCGIFVSTCVLVSCRMDPAPDFGLHDYEGHGKLKDKVGTGLRGSCCNSATISQHAAATSFLPAARGAVIALAETSFRQIGKVVLRCAWCRAWYRSR